jgi:predicted enzyme related to lactoylglutathione lyase
MLMNERADLKVSAVAPGSTSGSGGQTRMVADHGRFAWYELMTTDVAAARTFYAQVVGWQAEDASIADLTYTFLRAERTPLGGLMELPEEARRMGATPRWMGYIVTDVDATADRIKRLGGAIYVGPTNSNIGRIAVVADPQGAMFGLIDRLQPGQQPAELDGAGQVGWHELLAGDWAKAFAFYRELFGWQKADTELGPTDTYQLFSTAGQTIGGIFTKRPAERVPYWLYYFNVGDLDAALERVTGAGGKIFEGPIEVPGGEWIVRCIDPQGAIFALEGKRAQDTSATDSDAEVSWSTSWSGISSRGRLVNKPRR